MSAAASKLTNAAEISSSDAQTLIAEMRKAFGTMKSLAVCYERDGSSDKVKELEEMVLEMVASYEDCVAFAEALKEVPRAYQPTDEPTDFKRLIDTEVNKIKQAHRHRDRTTPSFGSLEKLFGNVNHAGEPMPGEEQEDVVMTSTQTNILNLKWPVTQKPLTELENPVRSVVCRHIYEQGPILHYIRTQKPPKCPIGGCFGILQVGKVVCDPLLRVDIEELRSSEPTAPNATNIEDFTDLPDDDNDN
ncbi:hypothetical protein ACP4OV_021521 [Aristida adscensionis]